MFHYPMERARQADDFRKSCFISLVGYDPLSTGQGIAEAALNRKSFALVFAVRREIFRVEAKLVAV